MTHRIVQSSPPRWCRPVGVAVVSLAVLAAAAATAFHQISPVLHVVALAALVIIPGAAAVDLLLSEPGCPLDPERERPPSSLRPLLEDRAIRLPLAVTLGAVGLLAVALALDAAGVPIRSTSVVAGTAALGALLILVRLAITIGTQRNSASSVIGDACIGAGASRIRPTLRIAAAVGAAAAMIVGAVAGAVALQARVPETYTTLTFLDASWLAAQVQPVQAGRPVRINWEMRSFGYLPEAQLTAVEVRMDGSAVEGTALDIGVPTLPTAPDQPTVLDGSVTFPAPTEPGRHLVQVSVYPYAHDGLSEREPVTLTGFLEVHPE
jgi:hypothetical protein